MLALRPEVSVLVTDVHMPGMGGFALAKHVSICRADISLLVMSAKAVAEDNEMPASARSASRLQDEH